MDTAPEPAGASCATGGTRVRTGADANGNGTLDESEATSTTYAVEIDKTTFVCNRTNGSNGTNGSSGYDDATRTIAGSDGTTADCSAVLGALGHPGEAGTGFGNAVPGVGCAFVADSIGIRYVSFTTVADAAFTTSARACACLQ